MSKISIRFFDDKEVRDFCPHFIPNRVRNTLRLCEHAYEAQGLSFVFSRSQGDDGVLPFASVGAAQECVGGGVAGGFFFAVPCYAAV